MRVVPCFALVALTVSGCAEDLGTCQMNAATQVVYTGDGTPYYAGQGLVQLSCANGVCHSVNAENDKRIGAPHDLNFDVAPLNAQSSDAAISALRDGIAHVRDHANEMYGEIVAGTMPPGEAGKRENQLWKAIDDKGNVVTTPLINLESNQAKATVRNWLACGAPVVAGVPGSPEAAASLGQYVEPLKIMTDGPPTFKAVYDTLFGGCTGCHNPNVVKIGLDLSTMATAYDTLVDKSPFAGGGDEAKCGAVTTKLVTPGKCDESLLYLKLKANPPCGAQMPPGGSVATDAVQLLCDWINAGATEE